MPASPQRQAKGRAHNRFDAVRKNLPFTDALGPCRSLRRYPALPTPAAASKRAGAAGDGARVSANNRRIFSFLEGNFRVSSAYGRGTRNRGKVHQSGADRRHRHLRAGRGDMRAGLATNCCRAVAPLGAPGRAAARRSGKRVSRVLPPQRCGKPFRAVLVEFADWT